MALRELVKTPRRRAFDLKGDMGIVAAVVQLRKAAAEP